MWCNSLLKLSLQIRASDKTYYVEIQNDVLELIKRKSAQGKRYFDGRNLRKQFVRQQAPADPFLDRDR